MSARIIEAPQGSEAWHQHRANHYNASDAPAAFGLSPYKKRADLIAELATGYTPEVDEHTQRRFDDGHRHEATARPWAEEIIGEELFPVVLADEIDGLPLSASYDGLTMARDIGFEHKTLNAELDVELAAGVIPEKYHPQLEQQLLIAGCDKILFMASNGGRESMRYAWYYTQLDLRDRLLDVWKQVGEDVAAYEHKPESKPQAVAAPVDDLPAVSVQVKGEISVVDNFKAFETALRDFIDNRLIREPQTDQDFADLDSQIKALKKAEAALDSAEQYAIAQVSSIDEMKRTKTTLHELARQNRLMAEKLLEAEKKNRRNEIFDQARQQLHDHIDEINKVLGKIQLPDVPCDIAGAMKGKKTIDSLRAAADQAVADAKIEASRIGQKMQAGLAVLREEAAGYEGLFRDAQQLVQKDAEDLRAVIKARIAEQKEAEEQRRQEEEARKAAESAKEQAPAPAPAPPAAEAAPAPKAAAKGAQAPAQRPSDDEIVGALAAHFAVTPDVARGWIAEMQLRRAA